MIERVRNPAPGRAGADGELLKVCHAQAVAFIERVTARFATAFDESIGQLSALASPGEDERSLLEELRLLRAGADRLGAAFRENFTRHYREALAPKDGDRRAWLSADAGAGFSLVDDQQLDEWLSIDRVVGKIGDTHGDALQALTRRFHHLTRTSDDAAGCPLGPDRFTHAFRDALVAEDVGARMRVRCFELLYRILVPDIGEFYAEINRLLIERGVLPELRATAVAASPARPRAGTQAREGEERESAWSDEVDAVVDAQAGRVPAPAQGPARPTPIHEQMFLAMQHLLKAHFREEGASADGGGIAPVAALPVTPMLIDTLSALQHDDGLVARGGELIRGGLREQVSGHLAGGAGLNRIDDETIEVISMIFDYILDDDALPDFMKALIGRLQIPVLKVAIIDREFFSRKSHPARQLLNELSQAGIGWHEESEAAKDRLYQKMEIVVRRILDEFDSDIAIFDEVLADFRAFLDEEAQRFDEAQALLLEAAQQSEREERITVRVAAEFSKRFVDRELPADIREFLLNPWRAHVVRRMLEDGEEADSARAALAFVDDLLWSLEPKPQAVERKRLVTMLPSLLETLRAGMRAIGHPEGEVERVVLALQDHHFECMKTPRRASAEPASPPQPRAVGPETARSAPAPPASGDGDEVDRVLGELNREIEELSSLDWDRLSAFDDLIEPESEAHQHAFEQMIAEMGIELERDEGPRIDDEFTARARALAPGAWLELPGDGGEVVRGKLAWRGDEYSSFTFVNRQYKVVAERPLYALADDFRHGRARVIEDVALFERAMDGVISGIMKFAGAATR